MNDRRISTYKREVDVKDGMKIKISAFMSRETKPEDNDEFINVSSSNDSDNSLSDIEITTGTDGALSEEDIEEDALPQENLEKKTKAVMKGSKDVEIQTDAMPSSSSLIKDNEMPSFTRNQSSMQRGGAHVQPYRYNFQRQQRYGHPPPSMNGPRFGRDVPWQVNQQRQGQYTPHQRFFHPFHNGRRGYHAPNFRGKYFYNNFRPSRGNLNFQHRSTRERQSNIPQKQDTQVNDSGYGKRNHKHEQDTRKEVKDPPKKEKNIERQRETKKESKSNSDLPSYKHERADSTGSDKGTKRRGRFWEYRKNDK